MSKVTDIKKATPNQGEGNIKIDEATCKLIKDYRVAAQKAIKDADSLIKLVCQTYLNAKGAKGKYNLNEDYTELIKE